MSSVQQLKVNEDVGSDSDEEGQVRNVSHAVLRPPGHTGKAKKGHLIFDAAFESGNLGRVDRISDWEYDLFVRPDISNPRFRFWFNFTVENVQHMQTVIFNLVNLSKGSPLFYEGFSPVVRSSSQPQWFRIPSDNTFYYRCPDHRHRYVLTIGFCFDQEDDVYQFALTYPYTHSWLRGKLHYFEVAAKMATERHGNRDIKRSHHGHCSKGPTYSPVYLRRELLGKSLQGRALEAVVISCNSDLYCLSDNNNPDALGRPKKVVIVTGRSHPAETCSSYVCQGLIDFLVGSNPAAECLRRYAIFWILPMLNPDGVFVGNTRTSIVGADLNRVWGTPSPIMHPEVALAKAAIAEIVARHGDNVDTYLDIHARCDMLGAFVSGKKYDDVYRMERHVLLPKLLSKIAHDFYIESTVYASVPLTSGTPRRGLGSILLEATNSYTLQVSCHGFYDKSTLGHRVIPYTEERYLKLGSNLGLAILDSYVTIGLVHLGPSSNQVSSMLSRKADTARNKTPEQEGENGHTFKLLHPFSKLTLQTSQAEENARKHSKAKREEEGERTNNDN